MNSSTPVGIPKHEAIRVQSNSLQNLQIEKKEFYTYRNQSCF